MAQAAKTYEFTDVTYMTASEKTMLLKQWRTFLDGKFVRKLFTKRIYDFLYLNCGFIAHYNIHGFYGEYFTGDFNDLRRFFTQFERGALVGQGTLPDYADIHSAMVEAYEARKGEIWAGAESEADRRFAQLKAWVAQAETDMELRLKLLAKLFG